jgi:hypothetical protein
MRNIIFTLIDFIRQNIPGVVVHVVRNNPVDSSSTLMREDAVNMTLTNVSPGYHETDMVLELDIIYNDENAAVDMVQKIRDLLYSASYTTLYDYTVVTSPVATKKLVYWEPIFFKRIFTDENCRFNGSFKITSYERF